MISSKAALLQAVAKPLMTSAVKSPREVCRKPLGKESLTGEREISDKKYEKFPAQVLKTLFPQS